MLITLEWRIIIGAGRHSPEPTVLSLLCRRTFGVRDGEKNGVKISLLQSVLYSIQYGCVMLCVCVWGRLWVRVKIRLVLYPVDRLLLKIRVKPFKTRTVCKFSLDCTEHIISYPLGRLHVD